MSEQHTGPIFGAEEAEFRKSGGFANFVYIGFGVILPAFVLLLELGTQWCAEVLFDPIPTWWHVLLVVFVPVTNLQTWLALRKGETKRPFWLSFANGVALFVALYYTIIFAPVTPIAIIAIIYFLIGLLPLAPFLSLIAAISMRWKLSALRPRSASIWFHWKAFAAAFVLVVAAFGIAELRFLITRAGIAKANSADAAVRDEGLSLLRRFGDRDYLLKLSYEGSGTASPFEFLLSFRGFGGEHRFDNSLSVQARNAFYRLTGRHYRQLPTPRGIRHWERFDNWDQLDAEGPFRVNNGLSLKVSQMDGSVDPDAALGYLEWTLVFNNETQRMQEAISQIQLPPDSVVSRLTLWINDEEREAAFAKSATVVEAYETVTATKRDPALVTVTGKDRIQLKCFPVPANGEMKVRIGITVPIALESMKTGYMTLPYFQDRNFAMSAMHSIWIESKNDLDIGSGEFVSDVRDDVVGLRGRIDDIGLRSPIKITRDENILNAWTRDKLNDSVIVRQELKKIPKPPVKEILLAVDTSSGMADAQKEIAEAVRNIHSDIKVTLMLAGGSGLNLGNTDVLLAGDTAELAAEHIVSAEFGGGTDAVPTLEAAMDAVSSPEAAIIWIHGPQPTELESAERLSQYLRRRKPDMPIYSIQHGIGRNAVGRSLNESDAVFTVMRYGSLSGDMTRLFDMILKQEAVVKAVRTTETSAASASANAKETSQHLVRLWANDEVLRLLRKGDEAAATNLAVKNQLVTRVSGAVVLETQQQYDQFGLKPVDPNTVPTIPEPEEYLLFGVILAAAAYLFWRNRRYGIRPAI